MATEDRLSDLPEPILILILSKLWDDNKAIVRTSVLLTRWRFLWKSVPVSLHFMFPENPNNDEESLNFVDSINREHHYWGSCEKIQTFKLLGQCGEIHLPRGNMPALVTAVLCLDIVFNEEDNSEDDDEGDYSLEKQYSNMKELLHSVAHVENLELSTWCIECMSILESEGWQPPPSSQKFLKLNAAIVPLDFP